MEHTHLVKGLDYALLEKVSTSDSFTSFITINWDDSGTRNQPGMSVLYDGLAVLWLVLVVFLCLCCPFSWATCPHRQCVHVLPRPLPDATATHCLLLQ